MLGGIGVQWLRNFSKMARKSFPKTGRGKFNVVSFKDAPRLDVTMQRVFTRQHMLRFGAGAALDNTILMLEALKYSKTRRLDSKKKKQLEALIKEHFEMVLSEDSTLASFDIVFLKAEIPLVFNNIKIYWQCKGDKTDELTQEVLDSSAYNIWKKLSESLHNPALPRITFVPNRDHLWVQEFESILKKADYGINYVNKDKLSKDKS